MYSSLVFRGGGVRGIAYAGALQVLEEKGILKGVQRVAGTSAGAITAMLVALKYNAAGIKEIVNDLDFASLEDGWDPLRVFNTYGLYKGDRALEWLETNVAAQAATKATFADLVGKGFLDLRVVATSLDTQNAVVFSADTTPHVVVSEAVRASMSIPLYFRAMTVQGIDDLFVDGGVVENYPITLLDNALGLYLTDFVPQPCPKVNAGEMGRYIKSLFETLLSSQDIDDRADPEIMKRTMLIDGLGISATDFTLSEQQKTDLFNSGVNCATKFLS